MKISTDEKRGLILLTDSLHGQGRYQIELDPWHALALAKTQACGGTEDMGSTQKRQLAYGFCPRKGRPGKDQDSDPGRPGQMRRV